MSNPHSHAILNRFEEKVGVDSETGEGGGVPAGPALKTPRRQ